MTELDTGLPPPPSSREVLKNLIVLSLVIGVAYVITILIGVERLEAYATAAGVYGALLIVLVKMTTIIVVPLGGGIVYPVAGAVYGFWLGWGLALLGDFLGFSIAFFLARFYGRPLVKFFVPESQWATFERVIAKSASWKTLIKARIAFSPVPELFAYAAGLTTVRYFVFISIMMLLQIPGTAVFTLFGDLLLSGDPYILIAAGFVGVISVVGGGWLLHRDLAND